MGYITAIAHVNLTVPRGTLHLAEEFYSGTLGLTSVPVPKLQQGALAWFDITPGGQQIHISFEQGGDHGTPAAASTNGHGSIAGNAKLSTRHPCFKLGSAAALQELKTRIGDHHEKKDGEGMESKPLEVYGPAARGVEYPTRFFARDYAGNLLEFSL